MLNINGICDKTPNQKIRQKYLSTLEVCLYPVTIPNAKIGRTKRPIIRKTETCGKNIMPIWSMTIAIMPIIFKESSLFCSPWKIFSGFFIWSIKNLIIIQFYTGIIEKSKNSYLTKKLTQYLARVKLSLCKVMLYLIFLGFLLINPWK